jgi:transposase
MTSIAQQTVPRKVAIGVDTHKHTHVAVALDELGGRLGELTVPADSGGYVQLERWGVGFGRILAFGIEGTGSYGAGVAGHLQRQGHRVIDGQPARPTRAPTQRQERCARRRDRRPCRPVRQATATPKAADGQVEMLRQIKIAKDTAVKARTQAIVTFKTLLVTAPPELREQLEGLPRAAPIDRCAGLRPGPVSSPMAAAKHALRELARRWQRLQVEVREHERVMASLTAEIAPAMVEAFGNRARHRG